MGIGWELTRKKMLQIDLVIAAPLPFFGCLRTRIGLAAHLRLRLRPNNLAGTLGFGMMSESVDEYRYESDKYCARGHLELLMGIPTPVTHPGSLDMIVYNAKNYGEPFLTSIAPRKHLTYSGFVLALPFFGCTILTHDPYWVDHTFYLSETSHASWQTHILQKADANVQLFLVALNRPMYLIFVCVFDTRRTVHGTMKQPTVFA